jgi:hypothetical protein
MKTLILLIVLAAAFLGGYYLGHQPDSPDIFGQAQKVYQRVSAAGQQFAAALEAQKNTLSNANSGNR